MVRIIRDFTSFLSASGSNNSFIIKMQPDGTFNVVVRSLKMSLDRLYFCKEGV